MLTPQLIAAMNKATGGNVPVNATPGVPVSQPTSFANQLRAAGQKAQTAAAPVAPEAQPIRDRIGADVQSAGNEVHDAITGEGANAGQTPLQRGVEAVSSAVSAVPKVASEVLPQAGRENLAQAGKAVGSVVDWLGEKIGSTQVAQDWVKNHPEAASQLENLAKVGSASGNIAGNILGAEGGAGAVSKVGDVVTPAATAVKDVASTVKNAVVKSPEAKASKDLKSSIEASMPLEDKNTRIDALRNTFPDTANGGVARKGILGTSKIEHSPEDIERGTTAHPFINGEKDPVKQIANINQGIKDTSVGVDSFLDSKAAPSNFADMRDYMETNKPSASLQKDPGASESYDRATQDALDTLYKTMKDSAKASGDFSEKTSGADIRKARIAIDQQISKELGENTFGSPQYKGIKAAEIDTRNLLNRMSEDMLRYPGQLEKLNKLNEFISSAKERGIEVDMKNPEVKAQLEKQFGLESTPEGETNAQHLSDQHKTMSQLYETRDNIIDKYQRSLGKNRVQETIQNSPTLKAGTGVAKRVIPFGIGTHL